MPDVNSKNIHGGIFGKMWEYTLRFAAILHLSDKTFDADYESDFKLNFREKELICREVIERAILLADYFYVSAIEVSEFGQQIIECATKCISRFIYA
ncbi:MAG: hypothetical protein WDO15_06430 [Bacteroidota bacterium]